MGNSTTIDDLLGQVHSRFSGLGELVGRSPLLSKMLGMNEGTNEQNKEPVQQRSVKTSWGDEFGYLVYMSFFPVSDFTLPEIALIDYSDRRSKEIHKGNYRDMGGVYDEHPIDMLKLYFEIAKSVGMPLDYRLVIPNKRHDDFEDHPDLTKLMEELKQAKERALKEYPQLEKETPQMRQIRYEIKKARFNLAKRELEAQNLFIESLSISINEKSKLIVDGKFCLGVVDWLTRYTDEKYFHQSMYLVHNIHPLIKYTKGVVGGPFQKELMKQLPIKNNEEPLDYFSTRVDLKLTDRIALSRERKRRYNNWQVRELEGLFKQNEWLRDIYGEKPDFKGKEMPRPYNLNLLYRNFIVLHNAHLGLNRYGYKFIEQRANNPIAYSNLIGIIKARDHLLEECSNIISELKESYRADLKTAHADSIKDEIAGTRPRDFERITGEGPISRGRDLETRYIDNWDELDKDDLAKARNYKDTLAFEQLLSRFTDTTRNKADLNKGIFSFFTIGGLTDKFKITLDDKPYKIG